MLDDVRNAEMRSDLRCAAPIVLIALLLLSLAAPADARPAWLPTLLAAFYSNDLPSGRACGASASLLGCGADMEYGLFGSDYALAIAGREAEFGTGGRAAAEPAPLTGFALFAGKFMGRCDVAALGEFRLRFKVILE